jgi:hypothetical protein
MEGNIASHKKIKDFLQIDISRFGEHDTLVALGQLGTKSFISYWISSLYVYVSTLKKHAEEIQGAISILVIAFRGGCEGDSWADYF